LYWILLLFYSHYYPSSLRLPAMDLSALDAQFSEEEF
jgi:hypothetical protein